mgnify:CR=1 FL=1
MKQISLSSLIAKHLFNLGFVVLIFYVALLVLSAYDLEDKILISLLELEANKASESKSIEDYNKTSSSQFTLYTVDDLPEWAQGEFDNELRPVRELTSPQQVPVHGKIFSMNNGSRVVLIFETDSLVQATKHIVNIIELLVIGCAILLLLGAYYSYQASKKIARPIKRFAEFVHQNKDLKLYENAVQELGIIELQHLVEGYNSAIEQQLNAIQREKQLNQDISHELRTPLTVLHGSLEVIKDANNDEHKQAALTRLFKINSQIQDLVNGVLWLAKDVSASDLAQYCCDVEMLLKKVVSESSENLGIPSSHINVHINHAFSVRLPNEILQVILRNLISNALAYSPDNRVSIELSEFIVSVSNNGALQKYDSPKGFGVGLSIVSRLCDKFGITIDVSSCEEKTSCRVDLRASECD